MQAIRSLHVFVSLLYLVLRVLVFRRQAQKSGRKKDQWCECMFNTNSNPIHVAYCAVNGRRKSRQRRRSNSEARRSKWPVTRRSLISFAIRSVVVSETTATAREKSED